MRHPLAAIPAGRRARVFVPLLVATFALMLGVFAPIEAELRTPECPQGIVSFELAGDETTAEEIIASWDARARLVAAFGLGIDYLFLVVYSTTIALGCVWAAGVLGAVSPALAALGMLLAWGQWLAAVLDAIENVALWTLLRDGVRPPWPAVAWWCAAPKFALVVAGILFTLAAAVVRLARGRR